MVYLLKIVMVATFEIVLPTLFDAIHLYCCVFLKLLMTSLVLLLLLIFTHCPLSRPLVSHWYVIDPSPVASQLRVKVIRMVINWLVGWVVMVGGDVMSERLLIFGEPVNVCVWLSATYMTFLGHNLILLLCYANNYVCSMKW